MRLSTKITASFGIVYWVSIYCPANNVQALSAHTPSNASSKERSPFRRKLFQRIIGSGSLVLSSLSIGEPAHAAAGGGVATTPRARGAFELDSEYYIRDLFGGNKKEGNVLPSKAPEMPPPRSLKGPLISLLLDQEFSSSCIPVLALTQQNPSVTSKSIATSAVDYRNRSARSFAQRAQWDKEDITDQYYFDLSSYALWKTAADALPKYIERDIFVRNVGRLLYDQMQKPSFIANFKQPTKKSLTGSEAAVRQVLMLFQDSNFCKGFKIGNDLSNNNDKNKDEPVFDALDDEDLQSGASIDCLVSLYEPATLGASLQITGEQSRFGPDYVGATLAALWESIGIKSTWEVFFVDPEYRPNPKDYYPNEMLLQFTLTL